jgi:hypothetical protein
MKNTATYSKRNIAIGFGAGVYGIILLFVLISGFANATINAIDTNYGGLNYLYYFTNQSNLLCAV